MTCLRTHSKLRCPLVVRARFDVILCTIGRPKALSRPAFRVEDEIAAEALDGW